jgi:N-acetylgalactosamine-N,N'-diacetylbacillosaminyl-diphospho-undecaprenol 4-alpha-N-acetylgalactosaminyltransferase
MKKKKIALLIYSLASGGAERVSAILLHELVKYYDVTLVLMNSTIFYDLPKSLKIIYLEDSNPTESGIKKLLKIPFLALKYKSFLVENDISISLSFMNRPNYINTCAKLLKSEANILISERTAPSQLYNSNSFKDKINRFLIKFLYPKADRCITNAKWTEYELNTFFKIPADILHTIYNPVDLKSIEKLKEEKLDIKKSNFTFVMLGRFEHQKNHLLLIEAFYKANLDATLWLIGDGYLKDKIKKKISNLGLQERILLLGRQKNPYKFLNKADCFVFSSNFEGFPNVLLEALSCELPIISTDCKSGPRELMAPDTSIMFQLKEDIEHAPFGILVPIKDADRLSKALKEAFINYELTNLYRKKAKIRANDFKKDIIISQYLKVINEQL